ncbi:HlyD family secretion protein [Afifella sp. YEN Y35]|uniref:HlyD family secretion protein n=1 Tax=Afifella sp. YEN Y35 TaxID=3388337 RepID=UPI0039E18A8C
MFNFLRSFSTILAVTIGLLGICVVLYAWRLPPFTSAVEVTENAYVRGPVTMIAPQVAGYVTEVPVQDFETVEKGDLLVQLDDRIYRQKLEQARAELDAQKAALANSEQSRHSAEAKLRSTQAQLAGKKAALEQAKADWQRVGPLVDRGVVNKATGDETRSKRDQAQAAYDQVTAEIEVARQELQSTIVNRASLKAAVEGAEAAVHLAEIDLDNTHITAPASGRLGQVGTRIGQYVSAGTQLVALVPESIWVVANFKETQVAKMRIGQPVTFTVDALEGASLAGHIERFSPATGSEFSVIKSDNASGNFTKVAQRLPVRIAIDPDQPLSERLAPGMSVVATVDTAAESTPEIADEGDRPTSGNTSGKKPVRLGRTESRAGGAHLETN